MKHFLLILFLLLGAAFCLSYLKEIDRLERDEDPNESGKKLLAISLLALVLSLLFTLVSADAGIIMLTLSFLLFAILAGIAMGHHRAWKVYCKRNPDLFEEN